jgi:transposase InsO family protein
MSRIMLTPEQQIRQRYAWFREAEQLGSVTLACRRLGISRKTYYKWWTRYLHSRGDRQALLDRSRRPHRPRRTVQKALRRRLVQLRRRTHLGPARLRALLLARGVRPVPSAPTIAKVLRQAGLTRRHRRRPTRYRRVFVVPRPGDLVQLDVKFVPYLVEGRQLYQYTAIDCCTRLRVVQLSEDLTLATAKAFAQYVLSTFPFPVRCVQTDNDSIFTHWYTAGPKTPLDRPVKPHAFTEVCRSFGAAHRLIPPRTPRLNGKVERSHETDDQEFYDLRRYTTRVELRQAFTHWLWHYNHTRLHTGAGMDGRTPLQMLRTFKQYGHIKTLKCYPC